MSEWKEVRSLVGQTRVEIDREDDIYSASCVHLPCFHTDTHPPSDHELQSSMLAGQHSLCAYPYHILFIILPAVYVHCTYTGNIVQMQCVHTYIALAIHYSYYYGSGIWNTAILVGNRSSRRRVDFN